MRSEPRFNVLKRWIEGREKSAGAGQGLIAHVIPYQDDLLELVLGDEAITDVELGLRAFVEDELGIQISNEGVVKKTIRE